MKTPQHLLSEFSGTGLPEEKQPGPALSAIPVAERCCAVAHKLVIS